MKPTGHQMGHELVAEKKVAPARLLRAIRTSALRWASGTRMSRAVQSMINPACRSAFTMSECEVCAD